MKYLLKTVDQEKVFEGTFEECAREAFVAIFRLKIGQPCFCPFGGSKNESEFFVGGLRLGTIRRTHYIVKLPDSTPEELEQKFERERDFL